LFDHILSHGFRRGYVVQGYLAARAPNIRAPTVRSVSPWVGHRHDDHGTHDPALSVGVGVFVLAGMSLVAARFAVRHALPIAPRWMIGSVRDDVETIRRGVRP